MSVKEAGFGRSIALSAAVGGGVRLMGGNAARARGWEVEGKLFGSGVGAIIGAIVGGGLEAFGVEVPVVSSVGRQVLLALAGVVLVAVSFLIRFRADGSEDEASAEPPPIDMPELATSIQTRRMDAAMPREVRAGRPTEVWVQILCPKSVGFRADLPQYTQSGEEIGKDNVRAGAVSVPFPKDSSSGKVLPLDLALEVAAHDFVVTQPVRRVQLSPAADSALVIFTLLPKEVHERAIVFITATARGGDEEITVGSVSLATRILEKAASADDSWVLASVPLAGLSESGSRSGATTESPDNLPNAGPSLEEPVVVAPEARTIACPVCGHPNNFDEAFCGNCGRFLRWGGESSRSPEDPAVVIESPKSDTAIRGERPQMERPYAKSHDEIAIIWRHLRQTVPVVGYVSDSARRSSVRLLSSSFSLLWL